MRVATLAALSAVGSFIHLPGPVSTVAFDSAPGFFAALFFGATDGAIVCGIGHMATAIVNGFPLGILHVPIALGLALAGCATGFFNKRLGIIPGAAAGVAINVAFIVTAVPVLGWDATIAFLPFLAFAAIVNMLVASIAYLSLKGRIRA
jgi:uncharacterized membrane protein